MYSCLYITVQILGLSRGFVDTFRKFGEGQIDRYIKVRISMVFPFEPSPNNLYLFKYAQLGSGGYSWVAVGLGWVHPGGWALCL